MGVADDSELLRRLTHRKGRLSLWITRPEGDNALRVVWEGFRPGDWSSFQKNRQDFWGFARGSYPLDRGKPLLKACGNSVDGCRGRPAGSGIRTQPCSPTRLSSHGMRRPHGLRLPSRCGLAAARNARGEPTAQPLGKRAPRRPSGEARLPVQGAFSRSQSAPSLSSAAAVAASPTAVAPRNATPILKSGSPGTTA
jgi:hypothetical protein